MRFIQTTDDGDFVDRFWLPSEGDEIRPKGFKLLDDPKGDYRRLSKSSRYLFTGTTWIQRQ